MTFFLRFTILLCFTLLFLANSACYTIFSITLLFASAFFTILLFPSSSFTIF
jgi:hypothetical protein